MAVIKQQVKQAGKGFGKARPNAGKGNVRYAPAPSRPIPSQKPSRRNPAGAPPRPAWAPPGGKGGGQWMFVPAGAVVQQVVQQRSGGQSFGKGSSGKGHKGKGKVMTKDQEKHRKAMDKLGKIDADLKVWVGGLPKDVTRGKLIHHFKDTAKPKELEIMSQKNGTACISFRSAEEATSAIDILNGSEIEGKTIEVDVWTKSEKKPRERKEKTQPKAKQIPGLKTSFLKSAKKGQAGKAAKMESKMKEKLKTIDSSLKAWVGGLPKELTWKKLKEHFIDLGCEPDIVDITKPGKGVVTFKTEDEATTAISIANGTEIEGSTIEVDVWTMPEKRERKKKTDDLDLD